MIVSSYFIAFVTGLLGGVHCIGMCGGIVTALSLGGAAQINLHAGYNLGRIASYALAGIAAGAIGGLSLGVVSAPGFRIVLYIIANALLIAIGLYFIGFTRFLKPLEQAGHFIWRRIQPLSRHFLPVRTFPRAFALGLIWGWLPCGLVYGILIKALTSGSALSGMMIMLAFGLGTLPNLLLAGFLLSRFRGWVQQNWVRCCAGCIVIAFGVYGLYLTAIQLSAPLHV